MRYVFWRMMDGATVTDAIRELHWRPREFWNLVDLHRAGKHPFKEEFRRAQVIQSRSFADSVHIIAEGRDRVSRGSRKRAEKMIKRALGTTKATKAIPSVVRMLSESLSLHQKDVMTRNKMQIDAAKWLAKTGNPAEYGEKQQLGIGGVSATGHPNDSAPAIVISFVGPDGDVVPFVAPKESPT